MTSHWDLRTQVHIILKICIFNLLNLLAKQGSCWETAVNMAIQSAPSRVYLTTLWFLNPAGQWITERLLGSSWMELEAAQQHFRGCIKNLWIPSCAGSGHQWSVLKAMSWSLLLPRIARGAVERAKANFLAAVWERIQVFQLWYQFLYIFNNQQFTGDNRFFSSF